MRYLPSEKSISRKIKEQYLAVFFWKCAEKQLEGCGKEIYSGLYLNTIPLHHGLCGVEAAAQFIAPL